MEKLVTILTPIYNRSTIIEKLYNSLLAQTSYNFEWLIVDDGSSDNIKDVVLNFSTGNFKINFIKKQNGGKHTALNVGIKNIKTELIFIVDSDDFLEPNSIERIEYYFNKYKNNVEICGFSFLRKFTDGKINGNTFKSNEMIGSYFDVRVKGNDTNSDKAEVYYTKILKEFPFPEFENEKFLSEDIVWMQIEKKYKMIHINEAIYVGEYRNDGLTNNRRVHNIKSPKGCYERAKIFLQFKLPLKLTIKNLMQLQIYGKFSNQKNNQILKDSKHYFLWFVTFLPSTILFHQWRNKYL